MPSYNKVLLIGVIVSDPELKFLPTGTPVTDVRLAVSRGWKKNADGSKDKGDTDFYTVTFWSKQAELVCKSSVKGRVIFLDGFLTTSAWLDKHDQKRIEVKVVASNFQFLSTSRNYKHKDEQEPLPPAPTNNNDEGSQEDYIPF